MSIRTALGLAAAAIAVPLAAAGPAHAAPVPVEGLLATLPVVGEDTRPYNRALFEHWVDDDRDGCDTRREVLIAESVSPVDVGPGCAVTGRWLSPYDGQMWTDPADVDVDHVVALSEAWDSGAHSWTAAERRAFANDLGIDASLAAVTDDVNQAKSDLDPAQWVPPLASARCDYAVDWVAVKYRWGLAADAAEVAALRGQLAACGPVAVETPPRARTAAPAPSVADDRLTAGEELTAGSALVSASGLFRFVVQGDGNLVVYGPGGSVRFASYTRDVARLVMQTDGNLVGYAADGRVPWVRFSQPGSSLVLQDDANLVLYRPDGVPAWASLAPTPAPRPAPPAPAADTVPAGQLVRAGQVVTSRDGATRLVAQRDGNVVVYGPGGVLWHSRTAGNPGAFLAVQGDGNLVVYLGSRPLWASRTPGAPGGRLVVQDDGNVVLYRASGAVAWSSRYDPTLAPPPVRLTAPPPPPAPVPRDAYYANCDAARRAGVAPILRGQPGYRSGLDRDGDGIACE